MTSIQGPYSKKPVQIYAFRFDPDTSDQVNPDWARLLEFSNNLVRRTGIDENEDGSVHYYVFDRLHNTWVEFWEGDWVVKGVQGEFYPVKADIFDNTYQKPSGIR